MCYHMETKQRRKRALFDVTRYHRPVSPRKTHFRRDITYQVPLEGIERISRLFAQRQVLGAQQQLVEAAFGALEARLLYRRMHLCGIGCDDKLQQVSRLLKRSHETNETAACIDRADANASASQQMVARDASVSQHRHSHLPISTVLGYVIGSQRLRRVVHYSAHVHNSTQRN